MFNEVGCVRWACSFDGAFHTFINRYAYALHNIIAGLLYVWVCLWLPTQISGFIQAYCACIFSGCVYYFFVIFIYMFIYNTAILYGNAIFCFVFFSLISHTVCCFVFYCLFSLFQFNSCVFLPCRLKFVAVFSAVWWIIRSHTFSHIQRTLFL